MLYTIMLASNEPISSSGWRFEKNRTAITKEPMITIRSLRPSKGLSRNRTTTCSLQDSSRAWMYAYYIFPQGIGCAQLRWSVTDLFLGNFSFPWRKGYLRVHLTDLWRNIVLVPIYNFIYIKIGDIICVWLRRHCPTMNTPTNTNIVCAYSPVCADRKIFVPAIKKSPRFYVDPRPRSEGRG